MSQWWTYRPEDFLLFSERVYWRLFELQNEALWPAQILALAAGVTVLALVVRPHPWSGSVVAFVLAVAWGIAAWTFLWQRYTPINWAIIYVIPLFAAQALLLAWAGMRGKLQPAPPGEARAIVGIALLGYALVLHPLAAIAAGRSWQGAEIFALAPDPTAIATLGVLATARGGWPVRVLFAVPVAWCALSALTLCVMGTWQAAIPATAIVIAVAARLIARRGGRGVPPA